jgi:hypothetical protein
LLLVFDGLFSIQPSLPSNYQAIEVVDTTLLSFHSSFGYDVVGLPRIDLINEVTSVVTYDFIRA